MVEHCIIIRCKSVGEQESALFSLLNSQFQTNDIFFSCDSDFEHKEQERSLKRFVSEAGLAVEVPTLGWRCGDHNFYSIYSINPNYKYYWIIEPDVHLTFNSLKTLLKEGNENGADLLVHGLTKRNPSWSWYDRYKALNPEHDVYGGLFALVRLSNSAVKFLFEKRLALAREWEPSILPASGYPNDEVFVCSMLMNNGFSGAQLQITNNGYFNLWRKHIDNIQQDLIVHPVYYSYQRIVEKERFDLLETKKAGTSAVAKRLLTLLQQNNNDHALLTCLLDVLLPEN